MVSEALNEVKGVVMPPGGPPVSVTGCVNSM